MPIESDMDKRIAIVHSSDPLTTILIISSAVIWMKYARNGKREKWTFLFCFLRRQVRSVCVFSAIVSLHFHTSTDKKDSSLVALCRLNTGSTNCIRTAGY